MDSGFLMTLAKDMDCLQILYQSEPGIAADKVLYSAMSEWLRAITLDVDPLLGSNKTGVTYEYLRYRGAHILTGLASTLLDLHVEHERAEELTDWMITAMLKLRELWIPYPGQVMCMPCRIVGFWQGHGRVLGLRPLEYPSAIIQIGLCHYERGKTRESFIREFLRVKERTEKLEKASKTSVQFIEDEECLRLSRCWPDTKEPLMWDKAQEWTMGTFPDMNGTSPVDKV